MDYCAMFLLHHVSICLQIPAHYIFLLYDASAAAFACIIWLVSCFFLLIHYTIGTALLSIGLKQYNDTKLDHYRQNFNAPSNACIFSAQELARFSLTDWYSSLNEFYNEALPWSCQLSSQWLVCSLAVICRFRIFIYKRHSRYGLSTLEV